MNDLSERVRQLEAVIRKVPAYIDNWEWARENFDVLKTVPGYHFPTVELEVRRRQKERQK